MISKIINSPYTPIIFSSLAALCFATAAFLSDTKGEIIMNTVLAMTNFFVAAAFFMLQQE